MKLQLALAVLILGGVSYAGEIGEWHAKHQTKASTTVTRQTMERPPHGITEIGLERGVCFGQCPSYTVTIRSDGTVRYDGKFYTPRKGKFTGKIQPYYFNALAQFIVESDFGKLADNYTTGVTDHSTVYTSVTRNGKRKVVSDYANSGPAKLWAIDELIDDLVEKTVWDKKNVKPLKNAHK